MEALRTIILAPGPWVGIAGESHYQEALKQLSAGASSPGEPVRCIADLVAEPDNEFDPNAVAVRIDGLHVGYLSRIRAQNWGPILGEMASRGLRPQVHAQVVGGRVRDGSREMLAVQISGAIPEGAP